MTVQLWELYSSNACGNGDRLANGVSRGLGCVISDSWLLDLDSLAADAVKFM